MKYLLPTLVFLLLFACKKNEEETPTPKTETVEKVGNIKTNCILENRPSYNDHSYWTVDGIVEFRLKDSANNLIGTIFNAPYLTEEFGDFRYGKYTVEAMAKEVHRDNTGLDPVYDTTTKVAQMPFELNATTKIISLEIDFNK